MEHLPAPSPSVFKTNEGDSLPTHSVFLSANSTESEMPFVDNISENVVHTLRRSFENDDSSTGNSDATKSMKKIAQSQQQYTHNQQVYIEKLHSYTPFQQQRKEQQPQLSLMKQNSWEIQENFNSYKVNDKQTAKSLEFVNFSEFGSQAKKPEPTRWSHDDVCLSTPPYNSAHQNFNNSGPYENSQYTHKNASGHQNVSKGAYYSVQQQQQQQQLQVEIIQRRYSNNLCLPHSYQQQQPLMQQNQPQSPQQRQKQPAKQGPSFDDLPLPTTISGPTKPKTFEEILAENLNGVEDPSAIAPKSTKQAGNKLIKTKNTGSISAKANSSKKKSFLKKNSRNWYKPAARYRKRNKNNNDAGDNQGSQSILSNSASIPVLLSSKNTDLLPPPPPVSPDAAIVQTNTKLMRKSDEDKVGDVDDDFEVPGATSTEIAFLSLLEKGKNEETDESCTYKNDGFSHVIDNSRNRKTIGPNNSVNNTEGEWGSINQRSFATASKNNVSQFSFFDETVDALNIEKNEEESIVSDTKTDEADNQHSENINDNDDSKIRHFNKSGLRIVESAFSKSENIHDTSLANNCKSKKKSSLLQNLFQTKKKNLKIQVKSLQRKNAILRQEHVNVEKYIADERDKIKAWRTNEEKRLKRERRVFERQARAQYQMPNRKDRQEIDALKGTVTKLKLDIQKKDSKHRLNDRRMKEKNAILQEKIEELEAELKYINEQVVKSRWNDTNTSTRINKNEMKKTLTEKQRGSININNVRSSKAIGIGSRKSTKTILHVNDSSGAGTTNKYCDLKNGPAIKKIKFSRRSPRQNGNESSNQSVNMDEIEAVVDARINSLLSPVNINNEIIDDKNDFYESSEASKSNLYNPNRYKNSDINQAYESNAGETIPAPSPTPVFKQPEDVEDNSRMEQSEIINYPDGKKEQRFADGRRYIWFRNGTEKEIKVDGSSTVKFGNGDIKTVDGRTRKVKYFYSKANTTHTTFPDGIEVFEFPNGQVEKHFADGSKEITFGDGTKKYIYSDGQQLSVFPNGKRMVEDMDGNKRLL